MVTVAELKTQLKKEGKSVSGSKSELIDRLSKPIEYRDRKVSELKNILRKRKLPVSGLKQNLVTRLELDNLDYVNVIPKKYTFHTYTRDKHVGRWEEDKEKINKCIQKYKENPHDISVVYKKLKASITYNSLKTLEVKKWLDDQVIHFYSKLIQIRSLKNKKPVYIFLPHFYEFIKKKSFKTVEGWIKDTDMNKIRHIYIPVNYDNHWALVVVSLKKGEIGYYDSLYDMGEKQKKIIENIHQWLYSYFNKSFRVKDYTNDIPKQKNTYDCGVFVCKYMERHSLSLPNDFEQSDIPNIRHYMTCEIIKKSLINKN